MIRGSIRIRIFLRNPIWTISQSNNQKFTFPLLCVHVEKLKIGKIFGTNWSQISLPIYKSVTNLPAYLQIGKNRLVYLQINDKSPYLFVYSPHLFAPKILPVF